MDIVFLRQLPDPRTDRGTVFLQGLRTRHFVVGVDVAGIRVERHLRVDDQVSVLRKVDDHIGAATAVLRLEIDFAPVVLPLARSEEHTSELQSLMSNSYAV